MDLSAVLDWLTGADAGAFLVVVFAASWLLEGSAWWQGLSSQARSLLILGGAGLLGAGAEVLRSFPEVVALVQPYVQPLIFAVLAWLGSQAAHKMNPDRA